MLASIVQPRFWSRSHHVFGLLFSCLFFFLLSSHAAHAADLTISGTVYSDEGSTAVTSGPTIKLIVGTTTNIASTTVADGNGFFSFSTTSNNIAANTPIFVFVDSSSTLRAAAITKASSSVSNITGLDLYQNYVIISHEATTTNASTTIADLATYDYTDDPDLQYTATVAGTDTLTVSTTQALLIKDGKTFNADSGIVTIEGSSADTDPVDGSFYIGGAATYIAGATTTINGDLRAGGTYNANGGITVFGSNVSQAINGTVTYYDLRMEGTGPKTFAENFTLTSANPYGDDFHSSYYHEAYNTFYISGHGVLYSCDFSTGCDETADYTKATTTSSGGGEGGGPDLSYGSLIVDDANKVFYIGGDVSSVGILLRCALSTGCDGDASDFTYASTSIAGVISDIVIDVVNDVMYFSTSYPASHIYRCDLSTGCDAGSEFVKVYDDGTYDYLRLVLDTTNNVLYFGNNDGNLRRCDISATDCDASGDFATPFTGPGDANVAPVIAGNYLYTQDGNTTDGGYYRCHLSTDCDASGDFATTSFTVTDVFTIDTDNNILYAALEGGEEGGGVAHYCSLSTGCDSLADFTAVSYASGLDLSYTEGHWFFDASSTNAVIVAGTDSGAIYTCDTICYSQYSNIDTTDLTVKSGGTLYTPNSVTISDDYINNGTTTRESISKSTTFYFDGSGTQTLSGTLTGNSALPMVSVTGNGTVTFTNNATTSDFIIATSAATVVAPSLLTLNADYSNTAGGTFTAGSGIVYLAGHGGAVVGVATGTSAFNELRIVGGGELLDIIDGDYQIDEYAEDTANDVLYAGTTADGGVLVRCPLSTKCDSSSEYTVATTTNSDTLDAVLIDTTNSVLYVTGNQYAWSPAAGYVYRCALATGCDDGADFAVATSTAVGKMGSMVIDPANQVLYIADAYTPDEAMNTTGKIYRCALSTGCDDGADFTISTSSSFQGMYDLAIDEVNDVLYVSASGYSDNGSVYRCVLSSGCDTWSDFTEAYDVGTNLLKAVVVDTVNDVLYVAGSGGSDYRCDLSTNCDASGDFTSISEFGTDALYVDSVNEVLYSDGYYCNLSSNCDSDNDFAALNITAASVITGFLLTDTTGKLFVARYDGGPLSGAIVQTTASTTDLTIAANQILAINQTETLSVAGDYQNNGRFSAGSDSEVVFSGTTAQSIGGNMVGDSTFDIVRLTKSGTKTFNNNASTTGALTIGSGSTVVAPTLMTVSGELTNEGTFTAPTALYLENAYTNSGTFTNNSGQITAESYNLGFLSGVDVSGSGTGTGAEDVNDVIVVGDYVYIVKDRDATACSQTAGSAVGCELMVFDIGSTTDAANPIYVAGRDADGSATGAYGNADMYSLEVDDSGDYLYVGKYSAQASACSSTPGTAGAVSCELMVFDISDPTNPTYIFGRQIDGGTNGTFTNFAVWDLEVNGDYLYLAQGYLTNACNQTADNTNVAGCELQVWDISTPSAPAYVAGRDADGASNGNGGIHITDISIDGNYLYVSKSNVATACSQTAGSAEGCEIMVFDITTPTSPTYVAGRDASGDATGTGSEWVNAVLAANGALYVAKDNDYTACSQVAGSAIGCELMVFDITTPSTPTYVAGRGRGASETDSDYGDFEDMVLNGSTLIVAGSGGSGSCLQTAGDADRCEILFFDVSSSTNPIYSSGIDHSGTADGNTGYTVYSVYLTDNKLFIGGQAYSTACSQIAGSSGAAACELVILSTLTPFTGTMTDSSAFNDLIVGGNGIVFEANASTTNLTINTDAVVVSPTLLSVAGDYTNNGTFTHNSGTVYLSSTTQQTATGTMTGTSAFYNLELLNGNGSTTFGAELTVDNVLTAVTPGTIIEFLGNGTTTIATATITGTEGNEIRIWSTDPGTQSRLVISDAYTVQYLDIKDSYACDSVGGGITATYSIDSGNNTCWSLSVGDGIFMYLSGTLYSDEGTTAITTGATLKIAVGTSTLSVHSTTTDASGNFIMNMGDNPSIVTGTPIVAFVDADPNLRAALVTKASSTQSIQNLDLYQNYLIVSHEGTTGTSTTLSDLAFYDNDNDTDLQFNATTSSAGITVSASTTLYINTSKTFAPGSAVTIHGNGTAATNGDFKITDGATYTAGGTTKVPGDFIASSTATFNPGAYILQMTSTTTGNIINTTEDLGNVYFSGQNSTFSFTQVNATATNFFINTNATVTAPSNVLTVEGDYVNAGGFANNSGVVKMASTGAHYIQGYSATSSAFNGLLIDDTGAVAVTGFMRAVYDSVENAIYGLAIDETNGVLYGGTTFDGLVYRCDITATNCDAAIDFTTSIDTAESYIWSVFVDEINNVLYVGSYPSGIIYRCDIAATNCDEGTDFAEAYDTASQYILDFAIDEANEVLYITSGSSGNLYRCLLSTGCDASGDFTTAYDTSASYIYSMIIDETNGVLYVGSQSPANIYRCDLSTACDASGDYTTVLTTAEVSIYDLAIDETNNILYAGSGNNGIIYRCDITATDCDASGDYATSSDLSDVAALTLVFDQTNQVLYVGTGNSGVIYRCVICHGTASETTVTTDLTIANGASFTNNTNTYISGDYTNNGTSTAGTSVLFNGSSAQAIAGTLIGSSALPEVLLSGAGTKTFSNNASTSGAVIINSGSTVVGPTQMTVGDILTNAGTLTAGTRLTINDTFINNGSFTAPSQTFTIKGSYINTGTFDDNNGAVHFSAFGQTASGSLTNTNAFNDVVIESQTDMFTVATSTSRTLSYDIVFDETNEVLYVGTAADGELLRCAVSTGCDDPADFTIAFDASVDQYINSLAVDEANGVLYLGSAFGSGIYRCLLSTGCDEQGDFSSSVYAIPAESTTESLVIASSSGMLFAGSGFGAGKIVRCLLSTDCDASGDFAVVYDTSESSIHSLIVDEVNDVLYVGGGGTGSIYRCTLSNDCNASGDFTTAYDTSDFFIYSLIIDTDNAVLYAGSNSNLYRCPISSDCDASGDFTTVYSGVSVLDLEIDTRHDILYFTDSTTGTIFRCLLSTDCDASGDFSQSYLSETDSTATSVGYDAANGVLYVTDSANQTIERRGPTSFNTNASTTDFTISEGVSFQAPTVLSIAGDYTNNGTFDANSGTIELTGTSKTISGTLTDTSAFNRVVVKGSYTASNNATTSSLTIKNGGSLTAPTLLSVGLNYTNNGTFTNGTTLYLTGDAGEYGTDTGFTFDTAASGNGAPRGITSDGRYFYVVDSVDDRVYRYNLSGNYIDYFSTSGAGSAAPDGIATDGIYLYIADFGDDEIYRFTLSGTYQDSFDTNSSGNTDPYGVATDGTYIYVTDRAGAEVYRYTMTGSYQNSFDTAASGNDDPWDITTDGTYLYVVDSTDTDVYRYTLAGNYIDSFDTNASGNSLPLGITAEGAYLYTTDNGDDEVYQYPLRQHLSGTLTSASDLGDVVFTGSSNKKFDANASTTDLTIDSTSATVTAPTLLSIAGDYTNNGTFDANSGTTTFNGTALQTATGTMTGTSKFFNLEITNISAGGSSTQSVTFGAPVTASGTMTMIASTSAAFLANATSTFQKVDWRGGDANSPVWLRSTANGTQWYLDIPESQLNVEYVNVKDSNASSSGSGEVVSPTSANSGNNSNWNFDAPATLTHVQDFTNVTPSGNPLTASTSVSSAAEGNALVVYIKQNASASRTYTVSDNVDGTTGWTKAVAGGASGRIVEIWYKDDIPAGMATVTVTHNQSSGNFITGVSEFSGFGSTMTVEATEELVDATGSTTHYASASGLSTANPALSVVIGQMTASFGEGNPGTGYTEVTDGYVDPSGIFEWQISESGFTNERGQWTQTGTPRSGTNIIALFSNVESTITGSSTISNHDSGQVDNAFNFQNKTNEPLFAFKLTPESGNATVTELVLTLSGAKKIDTNDFSNIRLYKDHDNDALYDATDEQVGGAGVMSLSDKIGTITFSTDFLATTTANYLVVADWNAPENGSFLNVDLETSGLSMIDDNGGLIIYGGANLIQHSRNNRGGGGGTNAQVGGPPPEGDGEVTGGTNEGGEQIGGDPDFYWPTSGTGDWSNVANAYDKVDGTYASTPTTNASSSFTDHGFSVPGGNQITGITVKLEVSGTTAAGDIDVALSWDGGTSWTAAKTTPTLTTTDSVVTLGGASDKWGRTWSPGNFSNANFSVRVTGSPSSNSVQIDALQVRVHHQATGGGAGGGGAI